MRVLMTADTVGGVWTYALDLARALGRFDVEVHLATLGAPLRADQRAATDKIPNLHIHQSGHRPEWMPTPWRPVQRAGEWLLELAARLRPNLVHLNGCVHAALPWGVPTVFAAHACLISWWEAVKGGAPPSSWDPYRAAVAAGLAAADVVVAPTAAALVTLSRCHGVPFNGRVIANGRCNEGFMSLDKQPFVFTAGRVWDEARNLAALDRCAGRLPWPVFVAGDIRPPDEGQEKQPEHLSWVGRLEPQAISWWLARAPIYALPARYEPFGLSVLEAALSGCALVLGDIDSLREVWRAAAVFVPPDDSDVLAVALRGLIQDPARRQVLAARARSRAEFLSDRLAAARYAALYHEMVGREALTPAKRLSPGWSTVDSRQ